MELTQRTRSSRHELSHNSSRIFRSSQLFTTRPINSDDDRLRAQSKWSVALAVEITIAKEWTRRVTKSITGSHPARPKIRGKSPAAYSTNQLMLRVAGYGYAKSGRQREAEDVIKRFKEIAKTQYVMSYFVAISLPRLVIRIRLCRT